MSDTTVAAPASLPLITKFRPMEFKEVLGHDDIINALERSLGNASHPHAFLLTGPSGVGKTTIARIIASNTHCDLLEIDAASNSGVDAMRELVEIGFHMPLSGTGKRMILIDECHTLSKNAWQAVLKILEEPPAYLYFALCTTESARVPETIKTRCYPITLRPVENKDIGELLDLVTDVEDWNVNEDVRKLIIQEAMGSPRQALTLLQAVNGAKSAEEVRRIVQLVNSNEPVVALCQQLLSKKTTWGLIQPLLSQISDDDMESASILMGRYFIGAMQHAKNEDQAKYIWGLLEALVYPSQTWDRRASFYAAVGRLLWV